MSLQWVPRVIIWPVSIMCAGSEVGLGLAFHSFALYVTGCEKSMCSEQKQGHLTTMKTCLEADKYKGIYLKPSSPVDSYGYSLWFK